MINLTTSTNPCSACHQNDELVNAATLWTDASNRRWSGAAILLLVPPFLNSERPEASHVVKKINLRLRKKKKTKERAPVPRVVLKCPQCILHGFFFLSTCCRCNVLHVKGSDTSAEQGGVHDYRTQLGPVAMRGSVEKDIQE